MTSHAVERLHRDIAKLKRAEHARDHDAQALKHDKAALKHDRNVVAHQHDEIVKDRRAIGKEHDALGKLRDSEHRKLTAIATERATVQQQYDATIDPATGVGDPALKARLDALDQREAGVHTTFDPKIGAKQQHMQDLNDEVQHRRQTASAARADAGRERNAVRRDGRALEHDKAAVQHARQRAKKDLEPAEYKMGLHATNEARHALGMHAVDHVIRPHQKLEKAVKIAEAAAALERRHGVYDYTQAFGARTNYGHGPTSKNGSGRITFDCSGFVGAVYKAAGLPPPYTSGYGGTSFQVAGCKNMKKVSEAHAKPGDVVVFPDHIALYIGHGKCVSMGQEGDPRVVTVAAEAAYQNRGIEGFYHPKGA